MASRNFSRLLQNFTAKPQRTPKLIRYTNQGRHHGGSRQIATYSSPHQAAQISVLQSTVDTSSADFSENERNMNELVQKLASLHEKAALGGSLKAREKHAARGKMLVRE